MTRLEQLLGTVKRSERELTIDAIELSPEQRDTVRNAATERGLHVSVAGRWLLIRAL